MNVSIVWTLAFGLGMAALFVAGRMLVGARGWRRLVYGLAGVAALFIGKAAGLAVGLNLLTVAVSAVLGVPGALLLAAFSFL